MDETTQAWLDSKFDSSGEPVADEFVEPLGDDFDFVTDTPRYTSEAELASAYAQANNDEAAIGRTQVLVDEQNFANLELQEQLAEEQLLEGYDYGEPQYGQPAWVPPCPPGVDPTDWVTSYQVAKDVLDNNLIGQAMQPQPLSAEQQFTQAMAAATTESLANLAALEQSRSERATASDAQAQAVYEAQLSQAEQVADDLIGRALEKHGAANYPNRAEVFNVANQLMVEAGYTQEVIAGMGAWQSEQVAREAIGQAARMAGEATITMNVLRPYGWKGPRQS